MEQEQVLSLEQEHKRARAFENSLDRVRALEEFKELTDSSSIPEFLKDRFRASADIEIKQLVGSLDIVANEIKEDEC